MTLDRDTVARWLAAYVRAWQSYDPEAIGALFSDNATYAWHPGHLAAARARGDRHGVA